MTDCPTRFTLVEWKTGVLAPRAAAAVEQHLGGCESCRANIAEIEQHRTIFETRGSEHLTDLRERLAAETVPEVTRTGWNRWPKLVPAACALAAAAAITLVVVFQSEEPVQQQNRDEIQFKGELSFEIVAKRFDRQFHVREGALLKENDALRFVVTTNAAGYLSVFSMAQSGVVSPFYPESAPARDPRPMRLERAGRHELPGSVILDAAEGNEYFIILYSPEPFDRQIIHDRVKGAGPTDLTDAIKDLSEDRKLSFGVMKVKKVP